MDKEKKKKKKKKKKKLNNGYQNIDIWIYIIQFLDIQNSSFWDIKIILEIHNYIVISQNELLDIQKRIVCIQKTENN